MTFEADVERTDGQASIGPAPSGQTPTGQTRTEQTPIEQTIADVVRAAPGVAGLSGGAFADLATYLPGGRLLGVRRSRGRTEIGLVLAWGVSGPSTVAGVRSRVRVLTDDPVDITIADIAAPLATPGERS